MKKIMNNSSMFGRGGRREEEKEEEEEEEEERKRTEGGEKVTDCHCRRRCWIHASRRAFCVGAAAVRGRRGHYRCLARGGFAFFLEQLFLRLQHVTTSVFFQKKDDEIKSKQPNKTKTNRKHT
jgi:hypothetical protein